MIASVVLKIQTNRNGLLGPSQLTNEKLKMRITTPAISISLIFSNMIRLIFVTILSFIVMTNLKRIADWQMLLSKPISVFANCTSRLNFIDQLNTIVVSQSG
jgi:hypothetical protein